MTTSDGSDAVLLMLTGVTVVIMALRLMVRAYRIEQQAIKQRAPAKVAVPRRHSGKHSVPQRAAGGKNGASPDTPPRSSGTVDAEPISVLPTSS